MFYFDKNAKEIKTINNINPIFTSIKHGKGEGMILVKICANLRHCQQL